MTGASQRWGRAQERQGGRGGVRALTVLGMPGDRRGLLVVSAPAAQRQGPPSNAGTPLRPSTCPECPSGGDCKLPRHPGGKGVWERRLAAWPPGVPGPQIQGRRWDSFRDTRDWGVIVSSPRVSGFRTLRLGVHLPEAHGPKVPGDLGSRVRNLRGYILPLRGLGLAAPSGSSSHCPPPAARPPGHPQYVALPASPLSALGACGDQSRSRLGGGCLPDPMPTGPELREPQARSRP